jgi:hypothetical protein
MDLVIASALLAMISDMGAIKNGKPITNPPTTETREITRAAVALVGGMTGIIG